MLDQLGVRGAVAIITAGWQEYEDDDEGVAPAIGRPTVNLRLHARSEALVREDPELVDALRERQRHLRHLQEFYRIRLDAIDDAARAIAVRHVPIEILAEQKRISVSELRHLDANHLEHCRGVHARFDAEWDPAGRPAVARHREEVAAAIAGTDAVLITGGHVMSLLNRLRLFAPHRAFGARPVLGCSAGAMVLTDRIVLFHDAPPFGKNLAQVIADGLGICPGIVAMPDVARRVNADELVGMRRFVQRMAPATCVALDAECHVRFERGVLADGHAGRVTEDGVIAAGWRP